MSGLASALQRKLKLQDLEDGEYREKRLARQRQFVYNTRLWKGSEEAVTRSTRNRVIGDEPVRGFESHPFRQFRY